MLGHRYKEAVAELSKLGRLCFGSVSRQPIAFGVAQIIGVINDLMSGGFTAKLLNSIDGPGTPTYLPMFGSGMFSLPGTPVPGVGDTIAFDSIPLHIDLLWGSANGSNTLFRTSLPYHSFSCTILQVAREDLGIYTGELTEGLDWFAPGAGDDRLVRLTSAPPEGCSFIAIYTPKQSIVRIGKEILGYEASDLATQTATICGRSLLCSELQEHDAYDTVTDVWCASMVERVKYNLLAFGASGRALEWIAMDRGSPRSDNPGLPDKYLRRMIFHTSCTMRGTVGTVELAIRYMFPLLYPYCIISEDPRWPNSIVIWYSTDILTPMYDVEPAIECWEEWLDHIAWPDGFPISLFYDTFYRDDAVDSGPYGDYFLDDAGDDGGMDPWPYPVVLSGPDIGIIGEVAPVIPPPYADYGAGTIDKTYLSYLQRPECLDKVLPAGYGVLILDYGLL